MGLGWEKLFKNSPTPANDSRALTIRYEPGEEAPSANSGSVIASLGALASGDQGRNGEAKSLRVARAFDSIGRRNESLRTHLDAIEFSFRNIEAIRAQFYDVLTPIDQTLIEIERTKVAHLEAERKLEGLTAAYERLEIRESEQRVLDKSIEAKSLEIKVDELEKDLASTRAVRIEAEAAHAAAAERSETLVKSVKDQEVALQNAEQKIAMLEARIEEQMSSSLGERAVLDERIAKLTKQFEAEAAARSFAEGALQTARQARSARLHGDDDGSSGGQEPSAKIEPAPGKIALLRR